MHFNPLIKSCYEIQIQIDELQQSLEQVSDELRWYNSIDPRALTEDIRKLEATAEKLKSEIASLETEIRENAAQFSETESAIATLTKTLGETKGQINGLQESEKQVSDELQWYSSIDPLTLTENLQKDMASADKLNADISVLEKEIHDNAARLGEIRSAIGPLYNPLNWFASDQVNLRRIHAQLRQNGNQKTAQRQSSAKGLEQTLARISKATSDLQRHNAFDYSRRKSDEQQIIQSIARKNEELAIISDRLRCDHEKLAHLREVGSQKAAQRQSEISELNRTLAQIEKHSSAIQRHSTFDLARRNSDEQQLKQSIARKKEELEIMADRKQRVDEVLAPLMQEMANIESSKSRAESDLEEAQELDERLSSADSSYERAMIHEECESRFDEGSPRKIIIERKKVIRQLDHDYDKASRRVEDIAKKAARNIDTIIIDGNNLCYDEDAFIGIAAIETLLPLLSRICPVVVVFDSSIQGLLKSNKSEIQKRIGKHAKVHIVASGHMADETILDLACANEFTYVLSNDRFGDFNEKSVVKDGRIIRYEIVSGNIFVHDLQIRATFA